MVTLTNRTNRHIEIEDKNGACTIINSKMTSEPLNEALFTNRTVRLISESKLIKKEIPVEKPHVVEESIPSEETPTDDKRKKTKK